MVDARQLDLLRVENAEIGRKRNFGGRENRYNRSGQRNFILFIDDAEVIDRLSSEGWNIKWTKPREEGDTPRCYLPVSVGFKALPPRVVMITGEGKVALNEETIATLDYAEIKNIDLVVRPRFWQDEEGKTGIKAWLKSMYVTLEEDEFESKYYGIASIEDTPDYE